LRSARCAGELIVPSFKVWLAADTPLYLPIYALADLGVLARVATTVGFKSEVKIEIKPSPKGGDKGAIEHMLAEAARADDSVIHLAIGDPTAACMIENGARDLALLGAFIKRPSFWLIGREPPPNVKQVDHRYIYYKDRYATGSFLGRQIAHEHGAEDVDQVEMGDEFDPLFKSEETCGRLRVLTADIVGIATAQERDPSIKVIESLGTWERYESFVTVGILTHADHLKNQKAHISLFLEAVRSACVLLRTAEKPAAALIKELIERGDESREAVIDIAKLQPVEAEVIAPKIAARLFEDKVYSNTLAISPSDWKGAVDARFADQRKRTSAEALFLNIYKPNLADTFTAEWLTQTFRDYGRFVQGIRVMKYSALGAMFTMIVSQILLRAAYVSDSPNWLSKSTPQYMYLTSLFIAIMSITWLVFAFITAGTNKLRPVSRLGYFLIAKSGIWGLPIFTITVMSTLLLLARFTFHIPISADNMIFGFTPILAASCWPALNVLVRRRYA
jgi:hypothetical protein